MDSVPRERDMPNAGHQIPVSDAPDSAALRGIGCGKLLAGGLGFVLLTVGIFRYQLHRIHVGDQTPQWDQLQWRYFFLILLCSPLETVSSGFRIWLICRVLQSRVGLWVCFRVECDRLTGLTRRADNDFASGYGSDYAACCSEAGG